MYSPHMRRTSVMTGDCSIKSIYPHQVGVVTNSTILLERRSSSDDANREDYQSEDGNSCPHSSISVVREIISRVVMPVTYPHLTGHRSIRLKGLLLVGPPGVGKTYAVRAVKHLCRSICEVGHIAYSISISMTETLTLMMLLLSRSNYTLPYPTLPFPTRSGLSMPICLRFCRLPIRFVCWMVYSAK